MTETLTGMGSMPKDAKKTTKPGEAERAAVRELVKAARARGEELTGPDGLLKMITATVLQAALDEEMTEHLGHEKHQPTVDPDGNVRNGTRPKTVLTDVDAIAISLYAKGLTTGEISAHFNEIYGASVSKDTVSRITDAVVEEMQAWASRPMQGVYAAIDDSPNMSLMEIRAKCRRLFIDAIYVKVRDGQVGHQPFYAAIGVDLSSRSSRRSGTSPTPRSPSCGER